MTVYTKYADYTKVRFSFDLDLSKISVAECDLLYDMMLSGYNSEFFIELSEKRGLFYDITGSVERYGNIGTLSFSYELREQKLYEALRMTVELLKSYTKDAPTPDRCMKAAYVDNAGLLLDDPRELNFVFAYDNYMLGRGYKDIADRCAVYSAVTPDRLLAVARLALRSENLTLAIFCNKKKIDPKKIKEIIKKL